MDRIIVGDTPNLGNEFYNGPALADPTTVTLAVTDPSGNTATYTYAASEITRTSTGVYHRNESVDEDGVWSYQWTATGTVADVSTGTFTVWPADAGTLDVLTVPEAKNIVDIAQTDITQDDKLRGWITATSELLDDACGPIRQRTVTAERHRSPGTCFTVNHWPISSVTAFSNYIGGAATLWANLGTGTGTGYTLEPRTTGTGTYTGAIESSGFGEWVEVSYIAGRYNTTTVVDPRFKQAAGLIMKNLFRSETISIEAIGEFQVPSPTFPAAWAIPNSVRDLLGDDWRGERNKTMSGVMFG